MLNRKSIERALAKYVVHKDPLVEAMIRELGPVLLKAADLAKANATDVPALSAEEKRAVRASETTLLATHPVVIAPEAFVAVAEALAEEYSSAKFPGLPSIEVDWTQYATPELMALAGSTPQAYFDRLLDAFGDDALFNVFVSTVLSYTLRVFLDPMATQWSRDLANVTDEELRENRPLHCPICGEEGAIASVSETTANGARKKLHCLQCGGSWLFERIRCAHCGATAASDLSYVHDADDDAHRLHVCKACGSVTPTVFEGDELAFNADVETIAMLGLEDMVEREQAQKEDDAAGLN